ncbi:hypothetical protein K466DRAFT_586010 [Polyporus arcularius HHB13444]|uniref:RNA polymerase II degradation factor 1 n=1 Tax=Polyporus arcularius HHB13444 TaxID=1314778 RepID=A0A5C3PDP7_9APHY|nr:hypothetical protein K466DRAFT_586010 [Polyporus arcularius HHB13444]
MYKSSNFRKSQAAPEAIPDKFRAQAKQLQEAFPSWSYDDLQSLLTETNGDVQLASTRIIEGHAEQWGSVTRKKDKKPTSTPKDSSAGRGDFRGGRGGRAARGGPRGGAARGVSARGGHHEVNGHRAKPSTSEPASTDTPTGEAAAPAPANGDVADADPEATSAWGSSTPTTWGGDTAAINGGSPHPASAAASTSAPAPTSTPVQAQAPAKVGSTPATSKLSWAQIARKPQEKPTPPPAPAPQPAPVSVPTPQPAPAQQREPSPPLEVAEPPATSTGWEEPTTVQAPTWDDEPRPPQHVESTSAPATADEPTPAEPSPKVVEEVLPEHATPPGVTRQPAPESPATLPPKPLTPSVSTRPTPVSHRTPKFKTTDQPVVLPASFGTGIEKVGMQFGSLSLGGEDFDAASHEPAPVESKPVQPAAAPEPAPAPAPAPVSQAPEPVAPITSPPSQASLASAPLFQSSASLPTQQPQPQQPPSLPPVPQQPQSTLPTSLSQPALSTQTALPTSSTTASISPYSQQSQPSLASHQSQQPQSQVHHSYGQHGLPTHLDQVQSQQQQHAAPVPQQQQQQQQPSQGQNLGGPSNYFRQAEPPYFHTPTPPAGQNQDSPYGAFGQLGQVQHQGQGSHLGNFGAQDYGYGESQRGFYDSYSGPTGFGNRNALGHDDIKGLPGSQQPHAAPGLPPANAQTSQQHPPSSQSSSQAQPSAGQGPQQSYPPPLPYYYPPYPQNQYYGSPYSSGYTVPQPFVKYPTVFQGPPGPQSAPSPATKQGPSSVQPQSPYGQSLYGQQPHSNAYDDIGYQHHTQHSVGQNVNVSSALPSGEYGKHQQGSLYGSGGQGMQGFMGLGQSSAPTSGPPLGQRAAAGSPENAYKPYGGNVGVKDVGAGVGVGQGPQGRGGVQQPGQGSFYAQRFAASQAGGPQGQQAQQPQGQGPQGHLGYPQGGSDGSTFYSYQPRQQQGYWQ